MILNGSNNTTKTNTETRMINLSAFGYEKDMRIQDIIPETWKRKDFIKGEMVNKFEEAYGKYVNAKYCVAVSSCTSALQMSLLALGVGEGDEVITTPYTWISSAECIKQVGATPVFVDINDDDMCIDVGQVKNKITSNTKAIIAVDLFGNVSDIDAIKELGIKVIEDAAQSTGAVYKDKVVGSIADITCHSFYPTKNLSCWGDAGAVTTDDSNIAQQIKQLRDHGQVAKFNVQSIGWNARMDTIHAEVLYRKLIHLDKWNAMRRQFAQWYNFEFSDLVQVPYANQHSLHVYHQYVIRSPRMLAIKDYLIRNNIQARTYCPVPLHKTKPYAQDTVLKNSENASATGVAIPVHQWLSEQDIQHVIKTVKDIT